MSGDISFHAAVIHSHICEREVLLMHPVGIVSAALLIQLWWRRVKFALKGRLIKTSRGCNIPVIPPGITTISHFSFRHFSLTLSVKLPRKLSSTSIEHGRRSAPGCRNHIVFNQSMKRSSVIQPFCCTATTMPHGNFSFGRVLRLKIVYGISL